MSVEVDGINETIAALLRAKVLADSGVSAAVRAGAFKVAGDAKKSISQGSHSGIIYKSGKGGKTHQASAPGEAPATDTGGLVGSIYTAKESDGQSYLVGSRIEYAGMLEFGTNHIKPRPWLFPALENNRAQIMSNIQKALDKIK